jgi:hypothetical protein
MYREGKPVTQTRLSLLVMDYFFFFTAFLAFFFAATKITSDHLWFKIHCAE